MKNYKYCKDCKTNKEIKDFIPGQEDCYKCVFKRKVAAMPKPPKKEIALRRCKMCNEFLASNRWAYCSPECAAKSKREDIHWSHVFRKEHKYGDHRFIF